MAETTYQKIKHHRGPPLQRLILKTSNVFVFCLSNVHNFLDSLN
ncbi:hypothetical protein SAMN05444166_4005 [Singulisphaera sp. GP187]|nr:hypothetical protein SAMN05444166_4005 [Singulisphaera sp. GP187]